MQSGFVRRGRIYTFNSKKSTGTTSWALNRNIWSTDLTSGLEFVSERKAVLRPALKGAKSFMQGEGLDGPWFLYTNSSQFQRPNRMENIYIYKLKRSPTLESKFATRSIN